LLSLPASPLKPAKRESGAPREGSKTAQVVAMLQRKNGATLSELMAKMGWQAHTVRGFMAGDCTESNMRFSRLSQMTADDRF
jgi:hypothetical protein